MRKFLLLIVLLSLSISARSIYCKDFNTQAEAQKYFKAHRKHAGRLDRDKDGEACECLKGGSSYSKSGCRRWRKRNHKH